MFKHVPCQVVAPLGAIVADSAVEGHLRAAFTQVASNTALTDEPLVAARAVVARGQRT